MVHWLIWIKWLIWLNGYWFMVHGSLVIDYLHAYKADGPAGLGTVPRCGLRGMSVFLRLGAVYVSLLAVYVSLLANMRVL